MKHDYFFQLRSDIQEAHHHVEELTDSHKLMYHPDKITYANFLLTHYLFHTQVDHHLKVTLSNKELQNIVWPDDKRKNALHKDLEALEINIKEPSNTIDPCTAAFSFGLCYVLKGSSMGDKFIYRELSKSSDFVSWKTDCFFKTSVQQSPQNWRNFKTELGVHLDKNYEDVRKGSLAGFKLFGKLHLECKNQLRSTCV